MESMPRLLRAWMIATSSLMLSSRMTTLSSSCESVTWVGFPEGFSSLSANSDWGSSLHPEDVNTSSSSAVHFSRFIGVHEVAMGTGARNGSMTIEPVS